MLHLGRLRLLRELSERGTIAAVADALQFTPSAVSQQLAMLEREAGVPLLQRAGRGVRLTDAALVLVHHAAELLDRAAVAEADLAAVAGEVAGRARIAGFESVLLRIALPAMSRLVQDYPRLRCEVVEAEPEQSLPALAVGDVDLVLGDEWQHQPIRLPTGVTRIELFDDPVFLLVHEGHPARGIEDVADEAWATGESGLGWNEMTWRTCRGHGGFEPDIRHWTMDSSVAIALVAHGLGVTLLPALALGDHPGVVRRATPVKRAVFAATRAVDAARPSTQAVLRAVQAASAEAASAAAAPSS
jgi:DNA-binding transcriptional LysR family regulator